MTFTLTINVKIVFVQECTCSKPDSSTLERNKNNAGKLNKFSMIKKITPSVKFCERNNLIYDRTGLMYY